METPDLAARLLIKDILSVNDADFITAGNISVPDDMACRVEAAAARHIGGEPVSRILGGREFWGRRFRIGPDTLDPRPDTETLVEAALRHIPPADPCRILDLGTGTGCIVLTLLAERGHASALAVDKSQGALAIASENARALGLSDRIRFQEGDWLEGIEERFDLIVSNPPYIPRGDIESLDRGVRFFDPSLALDGGEDGYDAYRAIFFRLREHLFPGGRAFFETGFDQADHVARLAADAGFSCLAIHPDMAGIPRVVEISFGEK